MILIIGSGGLAKQCLPLIEGSRNNETTFFDNSTTAPSNLLGYPVINNYQHLKHTGFSFAVCIGNPLVKQQFYVDLLAMGGTPLTLQAINASVSNHATLGQGNILLPFCLVEVAASIGNGNLISPYAGVFHDAVVGDFNEISPGALILGEATIGNCCRIGANATILPKVHLADNVIIGAGAVVTKSIKLAGTYVGVPAIKLDAN